MDINDCFDHNWIKLQRKKLEKVLFSCWRQTIKPPTTIELNYHRTVREEHKAKKISNQKESLEKFNNHLNHLYSLVHLYIYTCLHIKILGTDLEDTPLDTRLVQEEVAAAAEIIVVEAVVGDLTMAINRHLIQVTDKDRHQQHHHIKLDRMFISNIVHP